MNDENFLINYPNATNFSKYTQIQFFDGSPNLLSVFKIQEQSNTRIFFVTDATVASLPYMQEFISKFEDGKCGQNNLLILSPGEHYKTLESVTQIITKALEAGFNRNDCFVGIGGGVICDITAFAASIYKRGICVEFVPTTLLAMVDASIGGKTGCDFNNFKNMIGSFYPATKLYYWPEFIQSLPENQFKSGLAEVFKTSILFNKELFNCFENESEKILKRDKILLKKIIFKCVKAKATVVEKDLFEKNIRATLNLGHTFAHALESICGLGTITHGDAVAWGIGRVTELSTNKGYCLVSFKKQIFSILQKYGWETKSVPSIIQGGAIGERLLEIMHKDKKNNNSKVKLIIPSDIGKIKFEETLDEEILEVLRKPN